MKDNSNQGSSGEKMLRIIMGIIGSILLIRTLGPLGIIAVIIALVIAFYNNR